MSRMPALFVSHGAPDIVVRASPAHQFLKGLADTLPKPKAILAVSAHWETDQPMVGTGLKPRTIYDFRGFDPRLTTMTYDAPGAPAIARQAAELLSANGLAVREDAKRGWDHGVWTPLMLMAPHASVPVAQVSIQPGEGAAHHIRLGEALRPLREEGVMLVASGAMTHNLAAYFHSGLPADAPVQPWVAEFTSWMAGKVAAQDRKALADYRTQAPFAAENHPEDEHLLPLFVMLGAAFEGEPVRRVHASVDRGVLAMDAYRVG